MKLAQPLVLSTDVWTPGPFDQISILRRTILAVPPGSQGTEMRSVRKCLRDWVSVDKHHHISPLQASMQRYTKRHLRPPSLHSTTQTHLQRFTLINTIPSPPTTLHPPPFHTNNTTHHPPTKMSLAHQPPPSLSSLPEELSALIIQALPIPALAALSQTNRKFRRLCNWKLHEHRREWLKRTKNWTIFDPWKFFEPNVWDPREMWQRGI